MIGGGAQKITVEIGGKVAASLSRSIRGAQMQVSSFGRNVSRTMNDAALSGRRSMKGLFDNALWQQAAVGAAGVGIAIGASIRTAARFETVLGEIGKTANVSEVGLQKVSARILDLSARSRTNLGPEKLAAGIQDLVAQGLNLNDAVASIESLGRVATATNSDLLDVTKTGFQLQNALKIRPTELKATFDALAFAGKQGAFELKDMAQFMPTIAAAAGTLGIQGKQGAIALASMMQMVRKDAPDAGQAATRLTDAMLKMTSPDAVKNFSKFGVNIQQVLNHAKAKGINPMEAALAELQRVTGGDVFKLSQIFGDKEAKLALMSLMKYRKEYAALKAEAGGPTAAGTVDRDFQRSLRTFQGTLNSFQNSSQRLGIAVGQALLPPLTRLAEIITPAVEGIASWAAANPKVATGIVLIGGALAGLVIALPIIAGVISAIGTIRQAFMAVKLGGLIAGWLPVILNPAGLIVAAVVGIAVAAFLIIKNWKSISTFFANLWSSVVSTVATVGPKILGFLFPIPAMIIRLFQGTGIGQRIITGILDGLKARAAALFSWIGGAASRIGSMVSGGGGPAAAPAAPAAGVGNNIRPLSIPGRAVGGGVRAGFPYIVGERRPELFVPGMDGAVVPRVARPLPAAVMAALLAAPAPSAAAAPARAPINMGGINITINAAGGDAQAIAREVRMQLEDMVAQAESMHRLALND